MHALRKRLTRCSAIMVLLLLALLFCALSTFGAAQGTEAEALFSFEGIILRLNPATGDLVGISLPTWGGAASEVSELRFDSLYVDFCYDGSGQKQATAGTYLRDTLMYQDLDALATYELPQDIRRNPARPSARRVPAAAVIEPFENGVQVRTEMDVPNDATARFEIITRYTAHTAGDISYVSIEATLHNLGENPAVINGAAPVISGLEVDAAALFELPGNLPYPVYEIAALRNMRAIQGDYASALIHITEPTREINAIFVDPIEKWKPTLTKTDEGKVEIINLACALGELRPGETLTLGTQFLQVAPPGQGYAAARQLYASQGWRAPQDGVKGATIYSGHPAGVSDNDFAGANGTLNAYAEALPRIAELGFDSLWLLPVFEHPHDSGSIYLPYNMEFIDHRYAQRVTREMTQEEARTASAQEMTDFCAAAASLGIRTLIDYVPHGPYLYDEAAPRALYDNPWLTEERRQWITQDRQFLSDSGGVRDRAEWDCYAMDFANTDYLAYMRDLAMRQTETFGIAGTRIDAVMGSVPNWNPQGGHRASQTGLYGGAAMTAAIRQGFLDAGVAPLVLPENNNATPCYAPYTDLFYDMPFYRMTLSARRGRIDEQQFAALVAHWLRAEQATAPEGMQHGRFLENHDTVAPWYGDYFDGQRAIKVYGRAKARAMWTLLSTIDGSLIIYQNDELGNEAFFAELLAMRKAQFGAENQLAIEYLNDSASGIVAFRRYAEAAGEAQKLVLINLTGEIASRDFSAMDVGGVRLSTAQSTVVYGNATLEADKVTLGPYESVVIDLQGGEAYDAPNTAQQHLITRIKPN